MNFAINTSPWYDIQEHIARATLNPMISDALSRPIVSVKPSMKNCVSDLRLPIPDITSIDIKNDPAEKKNQYDENGKFQKPTVIMSFSDGTSEKASTSEGDIFSLEQGLTICLFKKLLSSMTDGNGSNAYNKLLHKATRFYKKQQDETIKKLETELIEKERAEKIAAKRAKRKAKYEAQKKEREISVQAEAYARALRIVKGEENK